MGADTPAEIKNLSPREHALQAQGVGDVVSAAQVPCGQLKQMSGPDGVLVKRRGVLGAEAPGWRSASSSVLLGNR